MRVGLTTSIATAIAIGVLIASGGPPANTANIWVDTNGGTCTRSFTPVEYNDAAACGSFSAAYTAASENDTVRVVAGTYAAQEIDYEAAKASWSGRVNFYCAANLGSVINGDFTFAGAQHLYFDGCKVVQIGATALVRGNPSSAHINDLTWTNGYLNVFNIASVNEVTISNNEIGNYSMADIATVNNIFGDTGDLPSTNVLIENNLFHNIITGGASSHAECIFNKAVDGLTIRNNIFLGCPGLALAFYDSATGYARNVLIENNFLSCGNSSGDSCYGGSQVVQMDTKGSEEFSNFTVRFNSSPGGYVIISCTVGLCSNNKLYGNVFAGLTCPTPSGWTFNYNVVRDVNCGGTNVQDVLGFVNDDLQAGDYHLVDGAPAIDFVPNAFCSSNGCPADDIDQQSRPIASAFDAGADEH